MAIHKQITNILNKEMDREGFLKHVGLGVLFFFGLGTLVKGLSSLEQHAPAAQTTSRTTSRTPTNYGDEPYGG